MEIKYIRDMELQAQEDVYRGKPSFAPETLWTSAAGDGQKLWMCTECQRRRKTGRYAPADGLQLYRFGGRSDIALYNTCAVRENAEQKVFGIIGQATHQKASRREMLIGVCGCMAQQEHVSEKIRKSFPGVDLVFGTHVLHTLPELRCTGC